MEMQGTCQKSLLQRKASDFCRVLVPEKVLAKIELANEKAGEA